MIGFEPRLLQRKARDTTSWKYIFHLSTYNILITNAGFILHQKYLSTYSSAASPMKELRDMVDALMNCEDILFNYLIPKEHQPPVYIAEKRGVHQEFKTATNAISITQRDHLAKREYCATYFPKVLGDGILQDRPRPF